MKESEQQATGFNRSLKMKEKQIPQHFILFFSYIIYLSIWLNHGLHHISNATINKQKCVQFHELFISSEKLK